MEKMKRLFCLLIAFLLLQAKYFAQAPDWQGEFTTYDSGLIYSEQTMNQLSHIVDSLNLRFKTCETWRSFKALPQAMGHYVYLETKAAEAKRDLESNIDLKEFKEKYPEAEIRENVLFIKRFYKDYNGVEMVEISLFVPGSNGYTDPEIHFKKGEESPFANPLNGKWILEERKGEEIEGNYLEGFFFIEQMQAPTLPDKYAKLVQYSDCMVDTTTQVLLEAAEDEYYATKKKNTPVSKFLKMTLDFPNEPSQPDNIFDTTTYELLPEYVIFQSDYQHWDSLRLQRVGQRMASDKRLRKSFDRAIDYALKEGCPEEFDYYAEKYHSPKTALQLKRKRRVIGGCSQDQRPRIHAIEIARLSAESANWEVFLRSHLDVMNDRFERMSDGSYAWGQRGTYIREIEALGINVYDLMMGISLRVSNPASNHYYGSVGRVGRALAESKEHDLLEKTLLGGIADDSLDTFNRYLLINLFYSYANFLEEDEKDNKMNELNKVILAMDESVRPVFKTE